MSDTLATRSLSPTNLSSCDAPASLVCTHKEYGDLESKENKANREVEVKNCATYTTVCTQCNRVLVPSLVTKTKKRAISIRLSRDEDGFWMNAADLSDSESHPTSCLSHGLCRSCFNNLDADLPISPLSLSSSLVPPPTQQNTRNNTTNHKSTLHLTHPLPSPPTPPRVLIVDDNKLQRKILARMVAQEGLECDIAFSGAQAIELAKKGKYSLVLMDLVMSPLDGWTTAKILRAFPSPPCIVAVTGLCVDEKLKGECKEAGMEDAVQKPISAAILNKVLRKHTPPRPDR